MSQTSVLYGQPLAIFEVMYERFIILRLVEVILVDLYINMVILQIICVKFLTSPEVRIDLVQLQRFFSGYKNLLLLIIETRLEELLLEDFLGVFWPFEGVEVVDDFSLDLLLLQHTFLRRFEADILKHCAKSVRSLPILEEVLHTLYVILDLPIVFLPLQFLHPAPSHLLNLTQLHQVFLHLGDLLLNIEVIGGHFALQFIEIIGDVPGKKRKDVSMVMHVVSISNTPSIALGTDQFLPNTLSLNAIVTPLSHLALRTCLAATLDHRQHLIQPHSTKQARLVVVRLLGETRRDKGVLDHHDIL